MEFNVFLSYAHSDKGEWHAKALESALKSYDKPLFSAGTKVYRDKSQNVPDNDLEAQIRYGLEQSEYLIFLADQGAAMSNWCQKELYEWCDPKDLNKSKNIIIVLIDGTIALNNTSNIIWEQTTALPSFLKDFLFKIPLFIDLRWAEKASDLDLNNPRYRQEINAISARLKNVRPEVLNDKVVLETRRNIQLRRGAVFTLSAMLFVSLGAGRLAYLKQGEAETQREYANAQADTARQEAIKARAATLATQNAYDQLKVEQENTKQQKQLAEQNFKRAEAERIKAENRLQVIQLTAIHQLPKNFDHFIDSDSLNWRGWGLSSIPGEIGKLRRLKYLDLSANGLSELPDRFSKLANLRELDLGLNELQRLPAHFGHLTRLENLNLGSNHLTGLPIRENELPNLKKLGFAYNRLEAFPPEITRLKTLRYLDISMNLIDSLPPGIGNLAALESLDLSDNRLHSLPIEFAGLQELKSLNLENNEFTSIPIHILTKLKKLNTLNLRGNSFPFKEYAELRRALPECHIFIDHK